MRNIVAQLLSLPHVRSDGVNWRFTATQEMFVRWNAQRLGISIDDSRLRFIRSWNTFKEGHRGSEFRKYIDVTYSALQVFADDSDREIQDAYRIFANVHFLRMLSYGEPQWTDDDPLIRLLGSLNECRILDFGCGLAQKSRTLAAHLLVRGCTVQLYLADIETIRREFLEYMLRESSLDGAVLACTPKVPVPKVSPVNVIFVVEVFEHVRDPIALFESLNALLKPGGALVTNLKDHKQEFMHLSPVLDGLRKRIDAAGYQEIVPFKIYRKV